jgi:hypothetical protein
MAWLKVITDPLEITASALALIFGVATGALRHRRSKQLRWLAPLAAGLAALCVAGGLFLAYQRAADDTTKTTGRSPGSSRSPAAESPREISVHADHIDQKVTNGAAVAGVGGNVTVNASAPQPQPQTNSKPPQSNND